MRDLPFTEVFLPSISTKIGSESEINNGFSAPVRNAASCRF
jgi:hypothetical protein